MTIQDVKNSTSITIELKDFPCNGREMVVQNEDGSYTIFLNSRLNWENQMIGYVHAMKHITGHDFEKENVQEIEAQAHRESAPAVAPIV